MKCIHEIIHRDFVFVFISKRFVFFQINEITSVKQENIAAVGQMEGNPESP